ncbi:hypothetical protein KC19_8G052500 [Ceratodon purpureus]|uniref:Uncharacterized protein n=1 Tax=Ceratodon purpureus TaxID=3225 RepID=A0A8T0GZV3_CERPU|nr:hypothetical protein KC19_8G052500 [Ceratodon purpureus]
MCKICHVRRRFKVGTVAAATFSEILVAILLPPLGVFLRYGLALEFWICLLLTILGYDIPEILYALRSGGLRPWTAGRNRGGLY